MRPYLKHTDRKIDKDSGTPGRLESEVPFHGQVAFLNLGLSSVNGDDNGTKTRS